MQKIILAVNALDLNSRAIDFAAYIAGLTNSALTGLFLEYTVHESTPALKTPFALPYVETITAEGEESAADKAKIAANKKLFENACIKRDVVFAVQDAKGDVNEVIIAESRYADVIVVSADTGFGHSTTEGSPTAFVKHLLAHAECPVIIAPESFDEIDEIVFACDGGKSCMHAIKQFTYLFPKLANTRLTLLHIAREQGLLPADGKIKQWLAQHYTEVNEEIATGDPAEEMFGLLLLKKNKFIVLGSYGRSGFSQAFKPSTSALILKTLNLPLFIAHT